MMEKYGQRCPLKTQMARDTDQPAAKHATKKHTTRLPILSIVSPQESGVSAQDSVCKAVRNAHVTPSRTRDPMCDRCRATQRHGPDVRRWQDGRPRCNSAGSEQQSRESSCSHHAARICSGIDNTLHHEGRHGRVRSYEASSTVPSSKSRSGDKSIASRRSEVSTTAICLTSCNSIQSHSSYRDCGGLFMHAHVPKA